MINISWGTKIAILYISFVGLIVTMVVISMNQKIDLVSDDYYDREIAFQNQINEMNNSSALTENVKHSIDQTGVNLIFPKQFSSKSLSGEVLFFRPSDNTKDFKTKLSLNENNEVFVGKENLSKGMYKMQISWIVDGKHFFNEETIVIP